MSKNYPRRGGPEPTPEMDLPRPTFTERTCDIKPGPTKQPAMAMAVERLVDAVAGYDKLFTLVQERFSPVCTPVRQSDSGVEKKEAEIQSDLVAAILTQAEHIRRVNYALGDMLDRCQL